MHNANMCGAAERMLKVEFNQQQLFSEATKPSTVTALPADPQPPHHAT